MIVGAGFAGLAAARALAGEAVQVELIDSRNFHMFQPLLYQVATAALEPEEIAYATRAIFHRQRNLSFRLATMSGVDWRAQHLATREGVSVQFDFLILAAGATTNDFGVPGVLEHAYPLKSLEDAIRLRSHVIRQFEAAIIDPTVIDRGALNFVIVGAGPTGVEMAGALVELFDRVLNRDFPPLDMRRARVIMLETLDRVLPTFHTSLQRYALATLRRRRVEVHLEQTVSQVTPDAVVLRSGESIPTRTVMWTAGVKASALADVLGVAQTRGGRIVVNKDLSVPDHPEVFVVGDMAASSDPDGALYPQLAPVAIQSGRHAAQQILQRLRGAATQPFVYRDPGFMATIGRAAAVAQFPFGLRLSGFVAWVMWLFLHLMRLVGFRNRLNVFINWAWNYFTYDRSARLIIDLDK